LDGGDVVATIKVIDGIFEENGQRQTLDSWQTENRLPAVARQGGSMAVSQ